MKKTGTVLMALAIITLAPAAWAQGHFGSRDGSHEKRLDCIMERLDLSDEQQNKISGIIDQYQNQQDTLKSDVRAAHDAMRTVMQAEEYNEAAIRTAHGKVSAIREELAVSHARMISEIKAVLTEDQLDDFNNMHNKRHQRRDPGKGNWRTNGPE